MDKLEVMDRLQRLSIEQDKLTRKLIDGEQRFRALARSVWSVQEEERKRLARELHDGIGQTLTALKLRLATMEASPEKTEALEITEIALSEARQLARLLRPAVLDDLGLAHALEWLCQLIQDQAEIQVSLRISGLEERLPPDMETLLFRLAQEALTNAQKHSRASIIDIRLTCTDQRVTLCIADNGIGFDVDQACASERDGFGLRSMRDRVELFSGDFSIKSSRNSGTDIFVNLGR
ncbi:sensor histidine kinase [Microbulbifer elongatus]|uniref:histidine kinase n=1 Tax=Microbulbifer elongatus TaxID=86173 RepID=A0ABT1P5Q0_9GAMM|nr:sensor histidine kinase [Microbulbifer elongatus]MCQ3830837.1 sensor histidine kinase [Microbulbifer elongatus]